MWRAQQCCHIIGVHISYGVGSACCSFTFPGNAKAFSGRTSNQYSSYAFFVTGHVEELQTIKYGARSSMFKIEWDIETGGILLSSKVTKETLGISPRPVWFEELDLLGLDHLGWNYPHCNEPLMWAVNKQYFYRGKLMFEAKGANIYDAPTIVFQQGVDTDVTLNPVDVPEMLRRNKDQMFLIESEAIEFIRDTYIAYGGVNRAYDSVKANQDVDYEALAERTEKRTKTKMAVVKQDCDSFDIVPLDVAREEGKRVILSTRIDRFIASFSGGKDSQVVLDLVTRAIPPTAFEVIYSDTGYELPPSLQLYEDVKRFYSDRFPALKFSTTRNHESVLNYWDKIGTPSDTHRWCCSVMKTAPLYRSLKIEGTNKQARVLTFDGVRAEESTRRSSYGRIGKGVKHSTTVNARPILKWSTTEIFLYLFSHKLPINPAYRQGITRVGCVICPFASEWNEYVGKRLYNDSIMPFLQRVENYTVKAGIKDVDVFIKQGNWKRRASGDVFDIKTTIKFSSSKTSFSAEINNCKENLLTWLIPVGKLSYRKTSKGYTGSLKYGDVAYSFNILVSDHKTKIEFSDCSDPIVVGLIRRSIYKSAYCIHCEACEVECPTGALSVLPSISIDTDKCIHCQKCLNFHDKGCIVAASLYQTETKMNPQTSIDRYKNFGLNQEWVDSFFTNPYEFWDGDHGLNPKYQIPSLRNWLKDAEVIDSKSQLTPLGALLYKIYQDNPDLVWEIIWINLNYNSFIVKWFGARVNTMQSFTATGLEEMLLAEFPMYKKVTVHNAVYQLLRTLRESPIGEDFGQYKAINKTTAKRNGYQDLSLEGLAYSLYRFASDRGLNTFRVTDLYSIEGETGVAKEFGIAKNEMVKKLRALHSEPTNILIAELNMGLDHITLREDLDATKVLSIMTE